jgi:alginate O-acetyltransferase complex protein AlgI
VRRRSDLACIAITLLLFAALNAMLFDSGAYRRFLAPDSSTAAFVGALHRTAVASSDRTRDILVLGDSRIFSGFDAAAANGAAGPAYRFINAGVPGTTPRCWYVFDRALDPGASRYRAVVVPVDTYSDDDSAIGSVDGDDRAVDLHYIVYDTRTADIVRIANSFGSSEGRADALFQLLLRGPILRDDIQSFAADPGARIAQLRRGAAGGTPALRDGSLAGLRADFATDTLSAPPAYPPAQIAELERQVLYRPQASPAYARYRREWLGPIVARYRAAAIPVIFVRIPTRPMHRAPSPPPSGSLAVFARRDGAVLLDQHYDLSLETPDLFVDADHLNVQGAHLFSLWLGVNVANAIAAYKPAMRGEAPGTSTIGRDAESSEPSVSFAAAVVSALAIGVPMRFQSYEFFIFFIIVTALFFSIRAYGLRRVVLLAASWYFYARWNAWYLAVLVGLTATDYVFGLLIEGAAGGRRRLWLTLGVAANLLFLGTAKYADFLSGSLASLVGMRSDPWALHVLVPIGISFHTFQSISYLADIFRGKIKAVRRPLDYALYLAFFPQLLAGPIVRAGRFFREWYAKRPFANISSRDVSAGGLQVAIGLIKKTVIADRFAPAVDAYFQSPAAHPGWLAAVSAILAFSLQIYFDFSGYSDIAIGLARILGFRFPPNFRRPYLSWSVSEFWRRWHMTLSYWLRDYVYIPIGGSRDGTASTVRNLLVTMLLGGLWHGANWTFVVWGGYHGALLSLERVLRYNEFSKRRRNVAPFRILAAIGTFAVVSLGWVLFRSPSFAEAAGIFGMLFSGTMGASMLDGSLVVLTGIVVALEVVAETRVVRIRYTQVALRASIAALLLFVLEVASYPGEAAQFIYFRF